MLNKTTAYFLAFVSIAAETIFLFVWAGDPQERSVVRVAVLFWPLFMVFLAEAMRISGRPGDQERLRRELIRLKLNLQRDETDGERLARKLDEVDHRMAAVLLWVLPMLAITFGLYLLKK